MQHRVAPLHTMLPTQTLHTPNTPRSRKPRGPWPPLTQPPSLTVQTPGPGCHSLTHSPRNPTHSLIHSLCKHQCQDAAHLPQRHTLPAALAGQHIGDGSGPGLRGLCSTQHSTAQHSRSTMSALCQISFHAWAVFSLPSAMPAGPGCDDCLPPLCLGKGLHLGLCACLY